MPGTLLHYQRYAIAQSLLPATDPISRIGAARTAPATQKEPFPGNQRVLCLEEAKQRNRANWPRIRG